MKIIHCMIKEIFEELGDAQKYIKKALECKMDYPDLSKMYYDLSVDEMAHATKVNDHLMRHVDTKKRAGMMSADVEECWHFEHESVIDMMMAVKHMQAMYR